MAPMLLSGFSLLLLLVVHHASLVFSRSLSSTCKPLLVVMGASMVDIGENAQVMPLRSASEFRPYGVDYFHKPAARYSNGRVISDFLSQGLGYGLLDPFLNSVEPDFSNGVNFASSGSTARNTTVEGNGTDSSGLFSLSVQIDQYRTFKAKLRLAESKNKGSLSRLPSTHKLSDAVFFIETAHNDYISTITEAGFNAQQQMLTTIAAIEAGLRELYSLGARNIIVMNLVPLGCTPAFLSIATTSNLGLSFDGNGCIAFYNNVVDLHNTNLFELISRLRVELSLKNLVLFDANAIYLDAVRNPSKYGVTKPFQACCGAGGGAYNALLSIGCGKTGTINGTTVSAGRCDDPSEHISWDGLHPVESFAKHIADGVLSGEYLKPKFTISNSCKG